MLPRHVRVYRLARSAKLTEIAGNAVLLLYVESHVVLSLGLVFFAEFALFHYSFQLFLIFIFRSRFNNFLLFDWLEGKVIIINATVFFIKMIFYPASSKGFKTTLAAFITRS